MYNIDFRGCSHLISYTVLDYVAERILAVARQKSSNEMWMAKPLELLPILYFATYFRPTAFWILSKTLAKKYAVAANKSGDAAKDKEE